MRRIFYSLSNSSSTGGQARPPPPPTQGEGAGDQTVAEGRRSGTSNEPIAVDDLLARQIAAMNVRHGGA